MLLNSQIEDKTRYDDSELLAQEGGENFKSCKGQTQGKKKDLSDQS